MNSDPPICESCGAVLDSATPGGLCPRCLMAGAMQPTEPSARAERPEPPSIGSVQAAFPQLAILEFVGQGGMGWVFKARQPKLNRLVALKLLPSSLAERDAAFAGRFEREGQLLARLHHPNIVAVHDSGAAGDFFYLLMEFVEGVNLRQAMRSSRFTPAQALAIVPHICDALQFAHEEGVLHRDIKPENILLDAKGRVKLVDFGIAKLMGAAEAGAGGSAENDPGQNLTQSGATLGTPSYMAPEQRDTPADVDHRADIYSLGVVFYELLTGELPTGVFAPPSAKSATDSRVDAIVQQALEKERTRRQSSAGEMKTQVETVSGAPTQPPPREHNLLHLEGITRFQSVTALRFAQAACVGFLGFLGYVPGWTAMFGFFGFFGLIGIAYTVEAVARRRGGGSGDRGNPADPDGSAWLSRAAIALIFARSSGVLGIVTFCFWPHPPEILVWSILVAALVGIALGIMTRKSRLGKQAIVVASINAAIWLIIGISVQFVHPPQPPNAGISIPVKPNPAPAQSKRQRFEPKEGMADKTSWGVYDKPSEWNSDGWAIVTRMTLGGVAQARLPGENDDFCRIKLTGGNDDEVTLDVEDLKANNNMTVTLRRDQSAGLRVNGIGYTIGYSAVYVAADQPDTTPFAFIVVTHSGPATMPAKSQEAEANAAPSKATFGPAIDRVIEMGNPGRRALNLAFGNYLVPGPGRELNFGSAGTDSLRAAGVDLYAEEGDAPSVLKTLDMRLCVGISPQAGDAPAATLDTVAADDVAQSLAHTDAWRTTMQSAGVGVGLQQPGTSISGTNLYLFITRNGMRGALQITGVSNNPPSVAIRYKLLQSGATQSDLEPNAVSSPTPDIIANMMEKQLEITGTEIQEMQYVLAVDSQRYAKTNPKFLQSKAMLARLEEQEDQLRAGILPPNIELLADEQQLLKTLLDIQAAQDALASLKTRYSDAHPNVIMAETQLNALQKQAAVLRSVLRRPMGSNSTQAAPGPDAPPISDPVPGIEAKVAEQELEQTLIEIQDAQLSLAVASQKYGNAHPRIIEIKSKLKTLEDQADQLRDTIRRNTAPGSEPTPIARQQTAPAAPR